MTEELKPCPFCGSPAQVKKNKTVMVSCTNCTAATFQRVSDEENALRNWNTRAESAEVSPMSPGNRTVAYAAANTLHELGYGWDGKAWAASAESAEVERLHAENKRLRALTDAARQIVNINENDYIDSFSMYEAIDNLANCLAQLPEES